MLKLYDRKEYIMGLDMYLTARKYDESFEPLNKAIHSSLSETKDFDANRVEIELGYWRKANSIHNWFVNNVQDGVDNCEEYYVTEDHLKDLLDRVNSILDKKSLPSETLPSLSGFFFGNTEYDYWYYSDLKHTKEILDKILSNPDLLKKWYIYYRASW